MNPTKPAFESKNISSADISALASLFPSCITESRDEGGKLKQAVNFDKLRALLGGDIAQGDESYDFTWVGKKSAMQEAGIPVRKTLRPVVKDEVIPTGADSSGKPYCSTGSKNWDTTQNLYIEGDNLDVLKLLQESYLKKVKMIYIDPPYNTGNDFIYNDHFEMEKDEYNEGTGAVDDSGTVNFQQNNDANPRFHSDWCSMIYPRLMLARNLLTDDGFIAISIGEEELDNLRKICNEVFGESNFRNIITIRRYDKNLNLQFVDEGLSTMNVGVEYVLIYSKIRASKMVAVYRESTDDRASTGYWKGFWNNADRPTMRYDILGYKPLEGQWKWQKSVADEAIKNYVEYDKNYSSKMTIEEYWKWTGRNKRFIRRNSSGTGKNMGVEHWVAPSEGILRNSNWSDILVSKQAGMGVVFDNPKNINMIVELNKLLGVVANEIVLDFFSGSATTAHAVMQLNAEDGGHRRFIMVQLPEKCDEKSEAYKAGYKTICDIGKERIRRAGDKINAELRMRNDESKKKNDPQLSLTASAADDSELSITHSELDIGFRVFKVDGSNMKDVYYSAEETNQQMLSGLESNIKEDRTDMDLLYGCLLDWGLPLSLPHTSEILDGVTVHTVDNGALIACFDADIPESAIRTIAQRKPLRAVFRDSSFATSPEKINVTEIFKTISPNTGVKVI